MSQSDIRSVLWGVISVGAFSALEMTGTESLLVLFSAQDVRRKKKCVFVHVCEAGHCGNVPERMIGVGGVHRNHEGNMRKSLFLLLFLSLSLAHTYTQRGLRVVTGFRPTIKFFLYLSVTTIHSLLRSLT